MNTFYCVDIYPMRSFGYEQYFFIENFCGYYTENTYFENQWKNLGYHIVFNKTDNLRFVFFESKYTKTRTTVAIFNRSNPCKLILFTC